MSMPLVLPARAAVLLLPKVVGDVGDHHLVPEAYTLASSPFMSEGVVNSFSRLSTRGAEF
jgi:hypothetical protein